MSFSERSLDAFSQGNVKSAQILFDKALKQDTDDELFSFAEELSAMGISNNAKKIYEELLKKYPKEDILKVDLAEIYISDGDTDKATNILASIDETSDAYLNALVVSADLYQTLGIYEVSEQKMKTALKLDPDDPVIQFGLAELYFNENKFSEAIVLYEKLLDEDAKEVSGISISQRLGAAYAGDGHYNHAAKEYAKTPMEFLNADNLFNYASVEYQLKHYKESQKIVNQLLKLSPDYSSGYILAAQIANKNDDYGQALKEAQEGLGYDSFNLALYELGAEAADKLGDVKTADRLLKQGIANVDDRNPLIMMLSDLYLKNNLDEENIALLDKYQTDLQSEQRIHWNLARSYDKIDKDDQANKEIMLVYKQYQNDPSYLHDLINILRKGNNNALTKSAVQRYLKFVPDDLEMNELLQEL